MILFPVASGIAYNLRHDRPRQGFIQRFAFSDSLSDQSLVEFRSWARERAATFVEGADQWLAANEGREITDSTAAESRSDSHAGIGVFYYEGPTIADVIRSDGKT